MTYDIRGRLSSALGESTQTANKLIAEEITRDSNVDAIGQLFEMLRTGSKAEKSDAIKVIGEISLRDASLLCNHVENLAEIASNQTDVLHWESLTALAGIAEYEPSLLDRSWRVFERGAETESVIARDQSVRGLCATAASARYSEAMLVLLDVLRRAPVNQYPAYAERIEKVAKSGDRTILAAILENRATEMPNPSKSRRVQAVLSRLS